jgi:hypothetical protein
MNRFGAYMSMQAATPLCWLLCPSRSGWFSGYFNL